MTSFENIPSEYLKTATENAPRAAQAKLVKEKLKNYLALYTQRYDGSHASAEAKARASEEYRQEVNEAQNILTKDEVSKAKLKSLEMEFSHKQSINATERAQISLR